MEKKVPLIESCPHFRDQNVHNRNVTSCPDYSGVLISGVSSYRAISLYKPIGGKVHGQILLQKCSMSHLNRYIPQMLSYINHLKELS